MFSLKRIIFIILAVVALGVVFFGGYFLLGNSVMSSDSLETSDHREFLKTRSVENGDKPKVLVVGVEDDESSSDIQTNVKRTLDDLQLSVSTSEEPSVDELSACDLLIICTPAIGDCIGREDLEDFIDVGGRVILAGGIANSLAETDFPSLLGIEAIAGRVDYHDLVFEEPFFPLQPEEASYSGQSDSVRLEVEDGAKVFVRSADDDVPLLYQLDRGAGNLFVINGGYLADAGNRGLLTGAISALMPDFVYPVLGVKAVFIDNLPSETEENDALCSRLYGYSTQRFVEGAVWPAFQGMCLRSKTPYTVSLLVEASSSKDFESDSVEVFTTVAKEALQFDGELAYAAECVNDQSVVHDQFALDRFAESFPAYTVRGLALDCETFSQKLLDLPKADIRCVREPASATDIPIAWENDRAVFPAATEGNNLRDGNMMTVYSTIGAYGLVSHVFDIEALISVDGGITPTWESDRWEIGAFESDILSRTSWLESRTLSQVKEDVRSYRTMRYGWKRSGEELEIQCSDAVVGQSFFYRSTSGIIAADGASYQDLGHGFYLLRLESDVATIQLKGDA